MHARRRDIDPVCDASFVPHEEWIARRGSVINDLSAVMGPYGFCNATEKVTQLTPRGRGGHQLDIFGVRSIGAPRPHGDERAVGREAERADRGIDALDAVPTGQ